MPCRFLPDQKWVSNSSTRSLTSWPKWDCAETMFLSYFIFFFLENLVRTKPKQFQFEFSLRINWVLEDGIITTTTSTTTTTTTTISVVNLLITDQCQCRVNWSPCFLLFNGLISLMSQCWSEVCWQTFWSISIHKCWFGANCQIFLSFQCWCWVNWFTVVFTFISVGVGRTDWLDRDGDGFNQIGSRRLLHLPNFRPLCGGSSWDAAHSRSQAQTRYHDRCSMSTHSHSQTQTRYHDRYSMSTQNNLVN